MSMRPRYEQPEKRAVIWFFREVSLWKNYLANYHNGLRRLAHPQQTSPGSNRLDKSEFFGNTRTA